MSDLTAATIESALDEHWPVIDYEHRWVRACSCDDQERNLTEWQAHVAQVAAARLAAPRDQTEDGLAERVLALASKYESLLDHYDRLHIADVLDDLETLLADQSDTTASDEDAGADS